MHVRLQILLMHWPSISSFCSPKQASNAQHLHYVFPQAAAQDLALMLEHLYSLSSGDFLEVEMRADKVYSIVRLAHKWGISSLVRRMEAILIVRSVEWLMCARPTNTLRFALLAEECHLKMFQACCEAFLSQHFDVLVFEPEMNRLETETLLRVARAAQSHAVLAKLQVFQVKT